jgi:hypothetical protein
MQIRLGIEEHKRRVIEELLSAHSDSSLFEQTFVLVSFLPVCGVTRNDGSNYTIPAEVGISAFSMRRGVQDNFGILINPGKYFANYSKRFRLLVLLRHGLKMLIKVLCIR